MGPGQVSMALATPEFRTPDEEVDVAYPLTEKKKKAIRMSWSMVYNTRPLLVDRSSVGVQWMLQKHRGVLFSGEESWQDTAGSEVSIGIWRLTM